TTATRTESDLADRLAEHLSKQGHATHRWRIRPARELRDLLTDIYDETTRTLYEANGTATRNSVRTLIGQLLDYRRHIPVADLKVAALLPTRLSDDLLDLIHSVGATCTWPTRAGHFDEAPPP